MIFGHNNPNLLDLYIEQFVKQGNALSCSLFKLCMIRTVNGDDEIEGLNMRSIIKECSRSNSNNLFHKRGINRHLISFKLCLLLHLSRDLRFFVSQAKLVTSVKKGKSVGHSAHRITPNIKFLLTKDSVLATN